MDDCTLGRKGRTLGEISKGRTCRAAEPEGMPSGASVAGTENAQASILLISCLCTHAL